MDLYISMDKLFYAVSFVVTGISTITLVLIVFANIGLRLGLLPDDDNMSGFRGFFKNFC